MKDLYYNRLQAVEDKIPRRDMLILMGDMNAKMGSDNTDRERVMGRNSLGIMSENGELFADFGAKNELTIGGTLFQHRCYHKATWVSPDHQTENQIDHITVCQCWRSSLQDDLLIAKIRVKLETRKRQENPRVPESRLMCQN